MILLENTLSAFLFLAGGKQLQNQILGSSLDIDSKTAYTDIQKLQHLSENQKIAIYIYMYVYINLSKKNVDILDTFKKTLNISSECEKTIKAYFSAEMIEQLNSYYQEAYELFSQPNEFLILTINRVLSLPRAKERKILSNLNTSEYEHPIETKALKLLQANKWVEKAIKLYYEYSNFRIQYIKISASCFKVTNDSLPDLYKSFISACNILDISNPPELYIENGAINAYTTCINSPVVVISSSALSLLNNDELMYLIGHELGHIKSNHLLYDSLIRELPYILEKHEDRFLFAGELYEVALNLISAWMQKGELTADRAGLLVCQSPEAVFSAMTKIMGFPLTHYSSLSPSYILNQAQAFDELDDNFFDACLKTVSSLRNTHPWMVIRAKEIDNWIENGNYYDLILNRA